MVERAARPSVPASRGDRGGRGGIVGCRVVGGKGELAALARVIEEGGGNI